MNDDAPAGALYIVEDDDVLRASLGRIALSMGLRPVMFPRADGLLALDQLDAPAVVLLDLRLPGMNGIEALEAIRARGWNLPVVFLTAFGDVPTVARAMKAGAFDFLEKPFRQQDIVEVLQAALERHTGLTRRDERRRAAGGRLATLTPREREIVPYLVQGWSSKRVADHFHLSKKTVDLHRSNVLHKTGTGNVAELVRVVVDSGEASLLEEQPTSGR